MEIELTAERIERGEYLAHHVMVCASCHSKRDFTLFAGPIAEGEAWKGYAHSQKEGLPGYYVASNLTPSNLGDWTDGEIFRAMTVGVSKDGRPLFPMMPYTY